MYKGDETNFKGNAHNYTLLLVVAIVHVQVLEVRGRNQNALLDQFIRLLGRFLPLLRSVKRWAAQVMPVVRACIRNRS